MEQGEFTIKQHYIPLCFLGQFSPDKKTAEGTTNPYDKRHIYQYDISSERITSAPIPIKSICYSNNLYEFQDEHGSLIYRNLIEKMLSQYEGLFSETCRSIHAKAKHKSNYNCRCFLSNTEKAHIIMFMATLILRNPAVINNGVESAKQIYGELLREHNAKNLTLQMCLPLYRSFTSNEQTVLFNVVAWFHNMVFTVGACKEGSFLTSDYPLIIYGHNNPIKLEKVIFPLSSSIVIQMRPETTIEHENRNRLVRLGSANIRHINEEMVLHSKRWIYSQVPFSKRMVRWILKKRKAEPQ